MSPNESAAGASTELLRGVGVAGLDLDGLSAWMQEQRWFAGKAREPGEVSVIDAIPVPVPADGDRLVLLIVEVRSPAGTHDLYQLPLGVSAEGRGEITATDGSALYDALRDGTQMVNLAGLIGAEARVAHGESLVSFHRAEGAAPLTPHRGRSLGVEQSNSSVVLDERHILKAFRQLEAGISPELEMVSFLAEHGFENVARVEGWYDYEGELLDTTLGIAQRFTAGARDGWELSLAALRSGDERELQAELVELGAVTGRMHAALASDPENAEFAPEEPSDEHLALLTATIDEQIERVFVGMPEREVLEPIQGRGEELRDRLALLSHRGIGGRLIRSHGDYHLGQVLLGPEGWIVVDFEGEPNRPLRERRRKRSPLRDVAGMLRSFAYAALAGELLEGAPAGGAGDWEARAREGFLEGYMAEIDQSLLPAGAQAIEKQLAMFELEKVLYELRYELENRPEWLIVPVSGIQRLLEDEP